MNTHRNAITASAIMNVDPLVIGPAELIGTAVGHIMENRYRSLAVVDDEHCFLGMFGVNCLLRLILPKAVLMEEGLETVPFMRETLADLHERLREVEDQPISICMKKDVVTVPPDHPLIDTLLLLYRTQFSIPVVEPGTCVLKGIVTYWDTGRHILEA